MVSVQVFTKSGNWNWEGIVTLYVYPDTMTQKLVDHPRPQPMNPVWSKQVLHLIQKVPAQGFLWFWTCCLSLRRIIQTPTCGLSKRTVCQLLNLHSVSWNSFFSPYVQPGAGVLILSGSLQRPKTRAKKNKTLGYTGSFRIQKSWFND